MRKRCSGFTLIEVLIAIAVIAILTAMTFVGVGVVSKTVKTHATKTTLENAKSLLAELDTVTRLTNSPPQWYWSGSPGSYSAKFFLVPHMTGGIADPLPAPGSVRAGDPDRATSDAIRNTGLVFDLIQNVPTAKTALLKIPSDQNHVAMSTAVAGTKYIIGQHVRVFTGSPAHTNYYEALGDTTTVPPGSDWKEAESSLIDAWGNPLIFVPGSGMRDVAVGDLTDRVIRSTGVYPRTGVGSQPPSNADRPFFASAGPDGNFQTGDDNIYSFEN